MTLRVKDGAGFKRHHACGSRLESPLFMHACVWVQGEE